MKDTTGAPPAPDKLPGSEPFCVRVRGRTQGASSAKEVLGNSPQEAILKALAFDVSGIDEPVLSWSGQSELVALDLDRNDDQRAIRDEDVLMLFPHWLPLPVAAWCTHGGGLRAVFARTADGVAATALAGVWHLLAPLGHVAAFGVEVKCDSRHPSGFRGEARCGHVFTFAPSSRLEFPQGTSGHQANEPQIEHWLEEHGLTFGRNPQGACPWCGPHASHCNDCVVVGDEGVRCYRCGRQCSWGVLTDSRRIASTLYTSARNCVHYHHQRLVLADSRPSTPESLLQSAWQFILSTANADRLADEKWAGRVRTAGSRRSDIVRSSSGSWLSARMLETRNVTERSLRELPWAFSGTRIDQALSPEALEGFVPIDPVPHSAVIAPGPPRSDGIIVRRPPRFDEAPPVELGSRPPDTAAVEAAWSALEDALPGLHRGYLEAMIVSMLVAQEAVATPPFLVVTGPSGSGKTAAARLAAGMLGRELGDVALASSEDTLRQIGLHLERGRSPLFIDEIGRVARVYYKMEGLLRLNASCSYRPKYSNERCIRMRAPLVIAGSTLPRSLLESPELARRAVGFQLISSADNWQRHGDVAVLRSTSPTLRVQLDVITAHVWWTLAVQGSAFRWRDHCLTTLDAVTVDRLDEDGASAEGRNESIRRLYEMFRTAATSDLTQGSCWSGWLDCSTGTPSAESFGELVDVSASTEQQFSEREELKRLDMGPVLGIEAMRLKMLVNQRGGRWLVKFVEAKRKGAGCARRQLPPLDSSVVTQAAVSQDDDGEVLL